MGNNIKRVVRIKWDEVIICSDWHSMITTRESTDGALTLGQTDTNSLMCRNSCNSSNNAPRWELSLSSLHR